MRCVQQELSETRKTPAPATVDKKGAWVLRVLMSRRGLSDQGLADAMLIKGIADAPARSTISRITREAAVPQKRHQRAIAEFFERDSTTIWKVSR